ncbi:MAG TPA: YHS domain-containing protein [candidate division Zixibacteria bacterium]|nr:YHS domain-containing protein [candidate division Zixibacteria bacterium]
METHQHDPQQTATATDPVCGMQVNPEVARAAGLTADYQGTTYYFCGRGCLLDFGDEPGRFFDPGYVPHM